MTARLVIVRHGNTFETGEAPRRVGLRTDLPLVESGRVQARRLGGWFAAEGWRFNRILCSPLLRTRETAEAIRAAQTGLPDIEPCDLLAEIDHGPDENRTEDEVIARIGAEALAEWDARGIAPSGWIADREERLAGWCKLFVDAGDGMTLLITSNGAARFALLADAGLSDFGTLKLRTGAYGVIEIGDAGPRLLSWDRRP